jgi:hypothetical protein
MNPLHVWLQWTAPLVPSSPAPLVLSPVLPDERRLGESIRYLGRRRTRLFLAHWPQFAPVRFPCVCVCVMCVCVVSCVLLGMF